MASIKKKPPKRYTPKRFMGRLADLKQGFDQLSPYLQRAVTNYILRIGANRRPHLTRPDETSIPYQDFYATVGPGVIQQINDIYHFFDISDENHKEGTTRGFTLPPDVQKIFADYAESLEEPSTELLHGNGNLLLTVPSAIDSRDARGNPRKGFKIASPFEKVEIDIEALQAALTIFLYRRLDPYMINQPDAAMVAQLDYLCQHIGGLIRSCETFVVGRGMKMERYRESEAGRLYALHEYALQGTQREIRNTALNGYYDYDIENCHYAIFYQMALKAGYHALAVKDYINDTRGTRERLSDDVLITSKQAKVALLMSLYGAAESLNPLRSIPKLIGDMRRLDLLYAHPIFMSIKMDLREGGEAILKAHRDKKGYTNILGKRISANENDRRILAHLMQGVEAKALDSMMMVNPLSTAVAIHDGFVSPLRLNLTELEDAIERATGFTFTVTVEQLKVSDIDDYLDF